MLFVQCFWGVCVNRAARAEGWHLPWCITKESWCTLVAQKTLKNNYRGEKKQ